MSTKKTQTSAAKKPAAKKPAVKAAPAKKVAVKAAPAKKASAKAVPAKKAAAKAVPAKQSMLAKAAKKVSIELPVKPSGKKKPAVVHKPITVKNRTPRVPLKKPEEPTAFENQSQSFAFSFAEEMKKRNRADEEKQRNESQTIRLTRRPTSRTKGGDSQQFPAADLAEFRKRLIILRQEALGQSATLRTIALEQTDERVGEDEDGSDVFMRLQNLSQVDSQNKIIQKIDEALQRISEGTYGICEVCGQLIRKPRLLNLPFVHTCMECQSEMEKPYGTR